MVIHRLIDDGRRTEEEAREMLEILDGGVQRLRDQGIPNPGRAMAEAIRDEAECEEA